MKEEEEPIEDILETKVRKLLEKESQSAAELDFVRKYLNDKAARVGASVTQGYSSPEASKRSDWDGIVFDDVGMVIDNDGRILGETPDGPIGRGRGTDRIPKVDHEAAGT